MDNLGPRRSLIWLSVLTKVLNSLLEKSNNLNKFIVIGGGWDKVGREGVNFGECGYLRAVLQERRHQECLIGYASAGFGGKEKRAKHYNG